MDLKKMGRFIASCRKNKKLTQEQLADKLNITSKAVSKWETGKCLPNASIMIDLSNILDITVTELLSGEKLEKDKMIDKADKNIVALAKTKEATIKATKYSYVFIIFALLLLITYNLFKYGINAVINKPEFFIFLLTGIIFWFTYLIIIKKMNNI